MCHSQLYNDLNATATHLKDVVNSMPELQTAPGRQVSAMGRGGGRGRGTVHGGRDGRIDRDGRGGREFDSGRGRGGRGNDRGRRGDRVSSSTTFIPGTRPDQDSFYRVKPNIVHRHVTSDRIFVDYDTYNNQMDATELHDVFQIKADLSANKYPLGRNTRKRTSEVAAMQRSVRALCAGKPPIHV